MTFPDLEKNFRDVQNEIKLVSPKTQIIVVTKEKPNEILIPLSKLNVIHVGENKMQGLVEKQMFAMENKLNFQFHLIAPIQTNKLKLLQFPFHYHCATEIRHLQKMKTQNIQLQSCLIQVNISQDPQKSGILPENISNFKQEAEKYYPISGLMTILENNLPDSQIETYYKNLSTLAKDHSLSQVSMGMSHDYLLAAKAGASFVRVGSKIVGER